MISFDAVCRLVGDLEPAELEHWVRERWVRPDEGGGAGYVFHEIDVARVRLIVALKREMAIDEEALPVVLGLLDQVYALRRRLRRLAGAIDDLPPDLRDAVVTRFSED